VLVCDTRKREVIICNCWPTINSRSSRVLPNVHLELRASKTHTV